MNKTEFIETIVEKTLLPKIDVEKVLACTCDLITNNLKKGEETVFYNLGKFKVSNRAARKGRNPRTGETIEISASRVPSFKAGKALKDSVNSL